MFLSKKQYVQRYRFLAVQLVLPQRSFKLYHSEIINNMQV